MPEALLEGLTVLDFTRVLAGPYCTRLLADLGARVLKIERPGEGDDTRRGYAQLEEGRSDQATYFVRLNAGKQSVGLDLGHPRGREVIVDLARVADVAIENFVPGVAARLGCDYAALSAARPDIVYCSISGFGQTGPLRDFPAFHHIINAMSGVMHLERQTDAGPRIVLSPPEVAALPHLDARQAFPEIPHPARGKVRVTATPFHVDGQPVSPSGGAPHRIGAHTRQVLGGLLGYAPARIEELAAAGIIAIA